MVATTGWYGGYSVLFGVALLARLTLSLDEVAYLSPAQQALWSWGFFGAFSAAFVLAAALAQRAGIPSPAATVSGPAAG